ncbi:hypothetical protein [Solibacillus daqui]|uniref:hypothetical protein n=1 Tax=Solibacillus daqui TaxID=2912187 RepID=UPI00236723A7|nr:hypothetical protein [Solibacillus daqui]
MEKNSFVLYSRSIFNISNLQKARFNELLKMAKLLRESCMEGEKILTGFTNIIGDTWYAFFNNGPILQETAWQIDEMQYEFIFNLLKNDEYIQWYQLTKGDELLSVLTAISMADQLIKAIKDSQQIKHSEQNQKLVERNKEYAKKRIRELDQKIQESTTDLMKEAYKRQKYIYEERLKNVNHEITTSQQQVKQQLKHISEQSLGKIIQQNKKKIHNTKKAIVTVGTMDDKKIAQIPLSDQFALAEKIGAQKELQRIADLVGRFKHIALKKQKTKNKKQAYDGT